MAEELVKLGDRVTVLTSQAADLPSSEVVNGVRLERVPVIGRGSMAAASLISMASYVARGWYEGPRRLDGHCFDVVNTHFAVPTGPLGLHIARKLQRPNVLTVHGGDAYDPSKPLSPHRHGILRRIVRNVATGSYCTIVNSTDTGANVHRYYGSDIDVRVLPYGINPPTPRNSLTRQDLGLEDDDFVLVAVGRMVARKQMSQLVDAVARMGDSKAKLCLLGDGPLLPDLRDQARQLGIENQVLFKGFVSEDEKFQHLWRSDVFCYTSQHEGFGIVFLEAMSCGLPVICYNNGGQTDFIEDGVNGRLVQLNELGAFVQRCRELKADEALRSRMSRSAKDTASKHFIDAYAKNHQILFQEATGSSSLGTASVGSPPA